MPSAGQISFVFDQTRMRWMTSLTSGRFQPPLSLTEGNTVDFVFRLSNNGTLFTPPLTPVWIFGIKDANTPSGDFLIQVNSATVASGVYTFVVELASAELQTWLATATSQSYAAIQITDSANDIATAPLLCQIAPNQNDTGTTPTSANGTLSVAAGKTVTFPQSLTFPAALGTNGFQLSTDGAGTLTWTASGTLTDGDKGEITVSNSGATWTIDNDVVTLAKLAHMATDRVVGRTTVGNGSPELLTISGTGSVAMTNNPQFTTPALGAATATSINAATGTLTIGVQTINLAAGAGISSSGGGITLQGGAGNYSAAGSINLSGGGQADSPGGSINLSGSNSGPLTPGGSINLSAGDFEGGSLNLSGGNSLGGSINTSDGGGSIDTTAGGSITTGSGSLTFTGAGAATFALGASTQTYTFPTTTATMARTDAAQTFTGSATQTLTGSSQTVATVNTTNTTSASAGAATANLIVQNTSTQNFAHVSLGFRSCSNAAPTIGYNGIISLDAAGRFNFGGDGGNSNSLNVTNVAASGASGAGVTLTGGGNITAIGTLTLGGGTAIANFRHGVSGACVAGVVTVTDTKCTANTRYFFASFALGTITLPASYYASTRTAATSFVITSNQLTDTSTVHWFAVEP